MLAPSYFGAVEPKSARIFESLTFVQVALRN